MDFGKRVSSAYQSVLDDLKVPNKRLITALTLLALEDIDYSENIVDAICQQVFKVDKKFKLSIIYLMDSIVKTINGGKYRELFSQNISNVILHVFETGTTEVRNSLCTTRQTWSRLLAVDVLNELDAKVCRIDSLWPYTQSQRKLMAEVKEVDSKIERKRNEISFLEQQLNSKKMCESKKRCRTEVAVDEKSLKKQNVTRSERKSSFDSESEMNFLSSVLLTPSPERENIDSDDSTFWSTMSNLGNRKSNSPILMEQNVILPFLNDSCHENDAMEINLPEVSVEMQNTNIEESFEQTNEETTVEKELEVIEPNVPFINLENYEESLCINPVAIVKTEPKEQEYEEELDYFEENENEQPTSDSIIQPISSPEPYRTSPPLMLSIDGNIELEPLKPSTKTSKQIKINLTNSRVVGVVEPRIESPKTLNIPSDAVQPKQKNPSEWKTPLISFKVKESMKNATFHEQPICRKGWEKSGMCSIM